MRSRYQQQCLIAGACGTGMLLLEEWQPESDLGIPVALEIVGKLQTPNPTVDKHGTHLEPSLKSGDAANDREYHGESDRVLPSKFFSEKS
jgi:hypothetical protein